MGNLRWCYKGDFRADNVAFFGAGRDLGESGGCWCVLRRTRFLHQTRARCSWAHLGLDSLYIAWHYGPADQIL